MARLVVGGVECFVDEAQLTLGHVVIPIRDVVAFGFVEGKRQMVIAYDRRGPELSYRERGAGRRAMVTLAMSREAESLAVLLRAHAREAWRGRHATVEDVLGEEPPAAIEPRPLWRRVDPSIAITVVIFVLGCALMIGR